jgi:hypothetical protein
MPSIRPTLPSEKHRRLADSYELSIGGYASELSNTRDPRLREIYEQRIRQARANAARYRILENEALERGE